MEGRANLLSGALKPELIDEVWCILSPLKGAPVAVIKHFLSCGLSACYL